MNGQSCVSSDQHCFHRDCGDFAWLDIYRDVFSKPRVRVSASRSMVHLGQGRGPEGPYLALDVTNFGPGTVQLQSIVTRNYPWWRKPFNRSGAVILHDWTNPLSAKLPAKLEPAEKMHLLLPWSAENNYFQAPFSRLGVSSCAAPRSEPRCVRALRSRSSFSTITPMVKSAPISTQNSVTATGQRLVR